MSNLVNNVYTVGEVLDQCTIEVDAIPFLPDIQVIVGIVKVVHPVILTCASLQQLEHLPAVITLCYKGAKFEPCGP
jgi:hypothetical protein